MSGAKGCVFADWAAAGWGVVVMNVAMRKASGEGMEQRYSTAWSIPGPPSG